MTLNKQLSKMIKQMNLLNQMEVLKKMNKKMNKILVNNNNFWKILVKLIFMIICQMIIQLNK